MKPGARVAGVAESYDGARSTIAAAVVRADRVFDGLAFGSCTVGGTDATARIGELIESLEREDLQAVFVAGIAPAWYNLIDLPSLGERVGLPVVSVSFEASEGLEPALRDAFEGTELDRRLAIYNRQPDREPVTVNDDQVWVRTVGADLDAAREQVQAFTPEGGRPEPLRVARLAARAADRFRADS